MKKRLYIITMIIVAITLSFIYECSMKNEKKNIDESNKDSVYSKLNLEDNNKKRYISDETVYIVIFDTGIQQAYAQSFYNTKYSCASKILSYDNNKPYASESRHGTLMQQFIDEISIRAGSINNIKSIHVKVKEKDNEIITQNRIVSMLNEVMSLKKSGLNIKVLNVSQVVKLNEEKNQKIVNAIDELYKEGIITVTSAGNLPNENIKYNAFSKSKNSIVVGGISLNNEIWKYDEEGSPKNQRIDVYTYASGIKLGKKVQYFEEMVSGTSYSAEIISWNIANYFVLNNNVKPEYVKDKIKKSYKEKNGVRIFNIKKFYKEEK